MTIRAVHKEANLFYRNSIELIEEELVKLDLLIRRRVIDLRKRLDAINKAVGNEQKHLIISHGEVDLLLSSGHLIDSAPKDGQTHQAHQIDQQIKRVQDNIDEKMAKSHANGIFLVLPHLCNLFGLNDFERQALIICLAPELDRKYDRLYAYLQDDITRKKPTIALILELLCRSSAESWANRVFLARQAPLLKTGLLELTDDPHSPSGSSDLSKHLSIDGRILDYILGDTAIDSRLSMVRYLAPSLQLKNVAVDTEVKTRLKRLVDSAFGGRGPRAGRVVIHLRAKAGIGKRDLAQGLCGTLQRGLLVLALGDLARSGIDPERCVTLFFREALLVQSAVYIDCDDIVPQEKEKTVPLLNIIARLSEIYGWLTFIAGGGGLDYPSIFRQSTFVSVTVPPPDTAIRRHAWRDGLAQAGIASNDADIDLLARRYRLTLQQIDDAAAGMCQIAKMMPATESVDPADLFDRYRAGLDSRMDDAATRIMPTVGWDDIVLPDDKRSALGEIANHIRHHYMVFKLWRFEEKIIRGTGLSVLFHGPSGTGKTLAAEVLAHDLRMDLFKIDLSAVVSKYIGETEKNLSRVFDAAESCNGILFFDEADALFGKRTSVTDAHDRYANIETSYLLQKMEEYRGMVILASNLRENMDEAFLRRLRFVVEFPFPDSRLREKLWRTHIPAGAPTAEIDFDYLSEKFELTGGSIKNIILNSAFLAAQDSAPISMTHLLNGTRREYEKMGKLWRDHPYPGSQEG